MTDRVSFLPADTSRPVIEATVGKLLRESAADSTDRIALVDGSPGQRRQWTYGELFQRAEGVAHRLLDEFAPGERVAIWAPTSPEWLMFWYGAALAGVTLVTVNPASRAPELRYVLDQSDANGLVLVSEFRGNSLPDMLAQVRTSLPRLRHALDLDETIAQAVASFASGQRGNLPDVSADDIAQIQYTSGTTGFPKGAMLHHRGVTNNPRFYAERLGLRDHEVYLSPMPMFHVGGSVTSAIAALWTRSTLVTLAQFEAGRMLELIETEGATATIGVPTMLIDMLNHPEFTAERVRSMRHIMCGGAYTPPELVRRLSHAFGATVHNSFGQTEGGPILTMTSTTDAPEDVAHTVGTPFPQVEIKIVDVAGGRLVPCGVPGELCARGYAVMGGYFRMPEETAAAIDSDGWLHTGDICAVDDRGYVTVEGRLKDMIIRGGENIFPREIEEVVFAFPGVADVAVVALPDQRLGETVGAFVRLDPGAAVDEEQLDSYVRNRLAREKVPAHWVFVDSFPVTPNGKIRKHELRQRYIDAHR